MTIRVTYFQSFSSISSSPIINGHENRRGWGGGQIGVGTCLTSYEMFLSTVSTKLRRIRAHGIFNVSSWMKNLSILIPIYEEKYLSHTYIAHNSFGLRDLKWICVRLIFRKFLLLWMAQCENAALSTRDMNFIAVVLLFENSPQCIIWVSMPLEILFLICQFWGF